VIAGDKLKINLPAYSDKDGHTVTVSVFLNTNDPLPSFISHTQTDLTVGETCLTGSYLLNVQLDDGLATVANAMRVDIVSSSPPSFSSLPLPDLQEIVGFSKTWVLPNYSDPDG
jgi:hypothetical protein